MKIFIFSHQTQRDNGNQSIVASQEAKKQIILYHSDVISEWDIPFIMMT